MPYVHFNRKYVFPGGLLVFLVVSLVYGCATQRDPISTTTPADTAQLAASPSKGRAQIWEENCMRCHNMRPPDWYSDAQWEVAMQHMRVRGYLTGDEYTAILELMKAGN